MSAQDGGAGMTDEELRGLDVDLMLRYGLTRQGAPRGVLFGDGVVAAALRAEELDVLPRSLAYLAEVVRRGGIRYAAELAEPLPGPERTGLAGEWLATASSVTGAEDVKAAETLARWLEAVAAVLAMRCNVVGPKSR
ncbi:hypothetical protein [Streptomyces sp. JJ38]|uniref:hypothetical protein n=1 Tax=Streptomyces sp. JJ38 TaxID=2738128 RepID=UPI001C5775AF|nr:hypothetical protein [Streptomyces sp. JJ38]MBW1598347.1 hypothetical protein [Streptomyces sp. JJ38]